MSGDLISISKLLVGSGTEVYLPYAVSKLRVLAKRYNGFALSQVLQVEEVTILLEIRAGCFGRVTLFGGAVGYEFFTTGATLASTMSLGFDAYRGYAIGAQPSTQTGKVKSKGLGSTVEPSRDPTRITLDFTRKNIWQVQGIPEHTYFPKYAGSGPRSFLVDSWTASWYLTNTLIELSIKG